MNSKQFNNTSGMQQDVNTLAPTVTTHTGALSDPVPSTVTNTLPPANYDALFIGTGVLVIVVLFSILFWKVHHLKST